MTDTLHAPPKALAMGPRYSFDPLDRLYPQLSAHTDEAAGQTGVWTVLGVTKSTTTRWRRVGMTTMAADRAAVAVGLNAVDLWPTWYDDAVMEPPCRWCGEPLSEGMTYCSREHRQLVRRADERARILRRRGE